MYGEIGFELLRAGYTPQQALDTMLRSDEGRDSRQVAIMDVQGRDGELGRPRRERLEGAQMRRDLLRAGQHPRRTRGSGCAREILLNRRRAGPLASRLMDALDAAQAAGGDARGMQSAAMVVTRALGGTSGFSDRVIDIRVDDSRTPLVDLRRLLSLTRPVS